MFSLPNQLKVMKDRLWQNKIRITEMNIHILWSCRGMISPDATTKDCAQRNSAILFDRNSWQLKNMDLSLVRYG
jgi:hypothetical protein